MTVATMLRQEVADSRSGRVGEQPARLRARWRITRHEDK